MGFLNRSAAAIALAAVTLGLLASACSAGRIESYSETYEVTPGTVLAIRNDNGSVTVVADTAGDLQPGTVYVEVQLTGADDIEFSVTAQDDSLFISAESDGGIPIFRRNPEADIRVIAPHGMEVRANTGNGSVQIVGFTSPGRATTGNGSITLDGVGDFYASSGNGSIEVWRAEGSFDLSSGNGSITLEAALTPGGESRLTTGNGRINVRLREPLDFALDAETDNGSVSSDLSLDEVTVSSSESLKGKAGSGAASLTIRAGKGSINLTAAG